MRRFPDLAFLFLLAFLVWGFVYAENWSGFAFTIDFKGLPKGAKKVGKEFLISFMTLEELIEKSQKECGQYHGIYFVQPVSGLVEYSAVAQCFVRGDET